MALKGSDLSATYKDWVHVNQSGAGLADHAGAEAALYVDDGDGGVDQICGRTAVRHWLDPHPDAASFDETWEFSTTGDMTQGELETAGWTFVNCTGVVSNGLFTLNATTATDVKYAYLTVSLAGDFDFIASAIPGMNYGDVPLHGSEVGGVWVGVSGGVAHGTYAYLNNGRYRGYGYKNGTMAALASGGTSATNELSGIPPLLRIFRISGTVYAASSSPLSNYHAGVASTDGWTGTSQADASTFNRLILSLGNDGRASSVDETCSFYLLRRFQ